MHNFKKLCKKNISIHRSISSLYEVLPENTNKEDSKSGVSNDSEIVGVPVSDAQTTDSVHSNIDDQLNQEENKVTPASNYSKVRMTKRLLLKLIIDL